MRHPTLLFVYPLLLAATAGWSCTLPSPPSKVPDGQSVGEAEMIGAMQTLRRYNTDVTNFTKCLEFEAAQGRITRDSQTAQHNDAVGRLRLIADRFNEQLRVFKATHAISGAAQSAQAKN